MSKRGILWRVLGDDPERWQSAEAWSVVADLCEQEGHEERAERLRGELRAQAVVWEDGRARWAPLLGAWRGSFAPAPMGTADSDGMRVSPIWDAYAQPPSRLSILWLPAAE